MFALSAAAAIVVAVMAMVFVRETPAFVKSRVEYPEQPYEVRHPAKVKRNKGEKQSEKEETRKAGVFPAFRRLLTNKTDLRWLAIAYMALTVGQLAISPATTSPLWPAAAEPVCQPLPKGLSVTDGVVTIEKDGKKLVSARPYTLLFRAPTDNDNGAFSAGIFREYTAQKETHLSTIISGSAIQVNQEIRYPKHTFLCQDTYESCRDGILVTSKLRCTRGKGKLPRFAKAFRLDSSFWQVEYLGRNGESYCDMKEHTQLERVACQVSDMVEPNIRPQESENRCDTLWAKVSDGETEFSFTAVQAPFELGIKPYSDRELLAMTHREEETVTGSYLTLSAFQMGIGSGSCGPTELPQYCFDCQKEYVLRFLIR